MWEQFIGGLLLSRNKWFKHYNTASSGNSIRLLWDARDYEAIAFWWRLLELVSLWETENERGTITLSWAVLRRELGWNKQKLTRIMGKIEQTFKIKLDPISGQTFKVSIPNWLELQGTWGGKRESRLSQDATDLRLKTEDRRLKTKDLDLETTKPKSSDINMSFEEERNRVQKMFSDAKLDLPERYK